jgi:glycosyltransferase involved in cell wall biosynthesis
VDAPHPRPADELDAAITAAGVAAPYVLTVGTIEPRKDFTTLARAVDLVRRHRPELTLVVVGPPGWKEVPGLDAPFVHVLGETPWPVVDALYRRADVCCIPSLYEGFGLPALESIARATPTVTTRGTSLAEVVADAGLLFAPGDADECAAAITRVLDDEELRAALAVKGPARAAELTWENTVAGHVRAYTRAVARS